MLGSISPVGEASRQQRWWLTAGAYTLASVAGGAAAGALLGAVGAVLDRAWHLETSQRIVAVLAVTAVAALFDARVLPWRLPTWHRQVDERWLTTYRGWVYGAGFGFQLGLGVATIVPAAVTYAALATAALTGSWTHGLLVGLVFGTVRTLPLLMAAGLRSATQLYAATARISAAEMTVHRAVVAGEVAVAVAAATALALSPALAVAT
jgi:sulfite exporter TauE/SafE